MTAPAATENGRGDFFAVDVPTFDAVCALGDPDVAAAYLILTAGTGPDNRTSSWSREAINKRTALNWRKADAAITKLEAAGLARWLEKSSRRPRIYLPHIETRNPIFTRAKAVVEAIRAGIQPSTKTAVSDAEEAANAGWLSRDESANWICVENRPMIPAWLPNSIVQQQKDNTGIDTIVERIRKSRDVMAFHLFINFYFHQNLHEAGGVNREMLRTGFDRAIVAATGQFQIMRFKDSVRTVTWIDSTLPHRQNGEDPAGAFFERVRILEDAGALEWSYHVAEDDTPDSILIFPVATVRHGKLDPNEPESIVGAYATAAACALAGEPQNLANWQADAPAEWLLPVDRLNRNAALAGVPRLRGRARTRNAARWHGERIADCREWIAVFRGIIAKHAPEMLAPLDQRFADFNVDFNGEFNVASMETSMRHQRFL